MGRFRRICAQHRDRIFTFAWYFLGCREDAEEVTQDVLLRLWQHWREIDRDRLPAWIRRVTRNTCVDFLRRRRSYQGLVQADADGATTDLARAPEPDPAAAAEAADFRGDLQAALRQLPEAHRAIVILREIQGMGYEEIAGSLGLPLNTVKVYLHRGRRQLRELLGAHKEND